jgi:asparagine synthase (glutamine-hydrolysing)
MRQKSFHPVSEAFDSFFGANMEGPLEKILWAEFHTKMVDDFLMNEDRTSMAHGLEVRVPFLDKALVHFAMSIPTPLLMKGNETKYLFRKALRGVLPDHTVDKKKWGFTFNPYFQFQKDLKNTAERILTRERVESRGLFRYDYIRRILDHKPHPRLRWHYFFLWLALGMEIWCRMFIDDSTVNPKLSLEDYFE